MLKQIKNWVLHWIGILFVFWFAYAWNGLLAEPWDTLSTDKWNELVNKVLNIETDVADKQNIVSWTCAVWSSIRTINNDGTVVCDSPAGWWSTTKYSWTWCWSCPYWSYTYSNIWYCKWNSDKVLVIWWYTSSNWTKNYSSYWFIGSTLIWPVCWSLWEWNRPWYMWMFG